MGFSRIQRKFHIKHALVKKLVGPKEFKISVQCLEQNMDIYHERKRLFEQKKHSIHYISCLWDINFDISEIISIKPSYDSTFLFIFSKRKDSAFFS